MFNAIRQHVVSWPLAIGEEPSDGEQKPQWGGLRISSDRHGRRIFWGLEIRFRDFFVFGWKILESIFLGSLICGNFWGHSRLMFHQFYFLCNII